MFTSTITRTCFSFKSAMLSSNCTLFLSQSSIASLLGVLYFIMCYLMIDVIFPRPGGRLKPGEDEVEGLKKKLDSKLAPPGMKTNWEVLPPPPTSPLLTLWFDVYRFFLLILTSLSCSLTKQPYSIHPLFLRITFWPYYLHCLSLCTPLNPLL